MSVENVRAPSSGTLVISKRGLTFGDAGEDASVE